MSGLFEHAFLSVPLAASLTVAAAVLLSFALRSERHVVASITGIAISVPWLTGLAVKVWLMHRGAPTWPLVWFMHALPMLVPVALLLALPLIVFAILARRLVLPKACLGLQTRAGRSWLVGGVVAGTVFNMVLVFTELFWIFDPIVFLAMPWIWLSYAPGALAGAVAGWLIGHEARRTSTPV